MNEDQQTPESPASDLDTPASNMQMFDETPADGSHDDENGTPNPDDEAAVDLATPSTSSTSRQRTGRRKAVLGVPIEVIVAVGKARPLLSELVDLRRDSVLTLDTNVSDPVEIIIGDRVIARGELQELDEGTGRLGVRLTEVADLSQSL